MAGIIITTFIEMNAVLLAGFFNNEPLILNERLILEMQNLPC